MYPALFEGISNSFDFLSGVESKIHVEVRKLYPDAELPKLDVRMSRDGALEMTYRSSRPFADLAEGLIRGCAEHYGEELTIVRRPLENGGTGCVFVVRNAVGAAV
jgi:hypothetical protein